jgi:hypothetical protein
MVTPLRLALVQFDFLAGAVAGNAICIAALTPRRAISIRPI